jgi:hypothetical protein
MNELFRASLNKKIMSWIFNSALDNGVIGPI